MTRNHRFTTPGNPARSKWSNDETVSVGPPRDGEAVADRMGKARQGLRYLPLREGHGNHEKASPLR